MKNETKIKVEKIYKQINKIALKGKDYIIDYKNLVDDIISKGNFAQFELCLSINYGIKTNKYKYIQDLKSESWTIITSMTCSPLIERLKFMYKAKGVYQIGIEVRSDDSGVFLGDIKEVDSVPYDSKYYYLNKKFAELSGMKKTFLEVTKVGGNTITIVYDNPKKSEETNLYQRYVLAIEYLLS